MRTIIVLTLLALCAACMEERGTYDYKKFNEVVVDALLDANGNPVPATFEAVINDTLRLTPRLSQTIATDESNLEFYWYIYGLRGESAVMDTISRERDLAWMVDVLPDQYRARFIARDVDTRVFFRTDFTITVVASLSGELMVLSEVDGEANVGMLKMEGEFVEDLYRHANGGTTVGENPVMIANAVVLQNPEIQYLNVFCDDGQGGAVVLNSSCERVAAFGDLFYNTPAVIRPQNYLRVMITPYYVYADFIINNGRLHGRNTRQFVVGTGVKFMDDYPGDYEMCKYALVHGSAQIFYDNKNHRFWKAAFNTYYDRAILNTYLSSARAGSTSGRNSKPWAQRYGKFDPDSVGIHLSFLSRGDGTNAYAFGQEAGDPNTHVMLRFYGTAPNTDWESFAKDTIAADAGQLIAGANGYFMSRRNPILFFCNGSKLYRYDAYAHDCKAVLDVNDHLPGSRADAVFARTRDNETPFAGHEYRLFLASSETGKSGKNGSLFDLEITEGGDIKTITRLYRNVTGRVVSMDFK
jgi:hypothetical protein